ncbi:Helicase required for RNAi-mediated heterochromatin assembly 1 [Stylophora pistillata]|uniref:Helicase required for RNAi-mediated heterochromatin assembly 1 n=1 Tax=Stylophora pistillata TaxID=50429 RepID=A0A2B4RMS3_STYPI|nr:Helicase required for RNAi-mediated heterochromatin assembly 1 [Stylophora pistillata]
MVADTTSVNRSTARSIVARYIREGRIAERPRGGANNVRVDNEIRLPERHFERQLYVNFGTNKPRAKKTPMLYHKRLLENFIENQKLEDKKQKSAGSTVTKRTPEVFVQQLRQFVKDAEQNDSFCEFGESERPALIDLLKENLKLCGVVVRKCTYSAHHYKASVLIKENCKAQDGHSALTEHVIDVENESHRGYDLRVGDIVEVTQCRRKEGVAMEPEVIKCYQRDQTEIYSFLTVLSASEGSTAALTELARCTAVWDYILERSKEQYDTTMAVQILSIVDKICSGAQKNMSHTVIQLVKKFQQSAFFKTFFPDFINEMTEDVSLVQWILEHVISAFLAAGPHVLPMAKVLLYKLVDNSTNLETAIENGRAAIDFLTKLSSIIALEVPQGGEDIQALQWKDLPLIPVVEEIREPMLNGRNCKYFDHVLTMSTILCQVYVGYLYHYLWSKTREAGYLVGVTIRLESALDLVKKIERAKERHWREPCNESILKNFPKPSRCTAVWDYILERSKEQYDTTMAVQILSIVDKICSGAQRNMPHPVIQLVKKFQQSAFFKTFFPDFVNKMTEDVSLVQRILEHVITAFPAAGPHVLPMAKALMYKLVDNSTNFETAIENGRAAIDFITKLSSIIALEVPQGSEDIQALQWKDLPLIPVVEEIREPRLKTDDLPKIRKERPYSSEEEYLNTYSRLLREECFYKLRNGISDFLTNGSKCSSKDMTMYRIVRITLCDKANDLSEAEFITQMQEVTNKNDGAYMARSQTFYQAFASAMEVLQRKEHVPFKEFLVYPESNYMEPPEYLTDIKSPPNWEIIFHKESLSCQEEESSYSPLKDLERMRMNSNFKPKLDPTQLAAVELALKNKLVLIQGPPGTGKSFVGVRLVRLLLSMKVPQSHGPILVVTYKNHALDNFLEALAKDSCPDEKIVRVGNLPDDADEKLKKLLLREVGRNWPQGLFDRKRTLTGKLWALQPSVRSAYQKLAFSSIFNAEMFLEEASADQIRSLLKENEREPVHGKELETLLKKVIKDGDRVGVRNNARLLELVKNALQRWLPEQEEFDKFVSDKQEPKAKRNVAPALAKRKRKEDPEQENPSDTRDPSVEEKERLLALDKDICDEEDEKIAQDVVHKDQDKRDPSCGTKERKLVCVDETKVIPHRKLLDSVKVWDLKKEERVQLVYVFQRNFYKKACADFLEKSSWYTEIHQQLKELRNQRNIEVMKKCHVIGMTVTGATMRANLLADIKPSVMIVEEAAEILEAQLVAVIPPSVQHLIMIGDHEQLKPTVHFHRLKKHHHLDLSLFERLINCKLPYIQLGFQCRMRDDIVDLLRELKIYDNLQTKQELVQSNDLPPCVASSIYFWTHTDWEDESKNSHSKRNITEAKKITEVARTFREREVPPSKITVLCSYRGQVDEVKKHFRKEDKLSDIKVTTIDSFQGQENDIILISLVRSNNIPTIGYLSSMNRLCVAISRARCGLYLFGNDTHFARKSRGWRVIRDSMRKKHCVGRVFPFCLGDKVRGDGYHGSPPTRDENRGSTIINAQNVLIGGGDGSVNTMNVDRGNSPSGTTTPRRLEMPPPPSGKTPVQDPKSPSPSPVSSPLRMERSDTGADSSSVPLHGNERDGSVVVDARPNEITGVESEKDARMPIQEAPAADDASLDLNDMENMKERPEQESGTPGKSTSDSPVAVDESVPSDKDARRPMQEAPEPQKSPESVEFENMKERPVQESKNATSDSSIKGDNALTSGKEARRPTQESTEQEKSPPGSSKEESIKEMPIEELADERHSEETAVQESEETPKKEDESRSHPVRHVYQEGDLKEQKKETLAQETINQSGEETDSQCPDDPVQETQGLGKVKEDEDLRPYKDVECSEATTRCETESKDSREEALPTQETMAAGKGPFEETGLEVGVKGHPTD